MYKCISGISLQSIFLQGVWRQFLSLIMGIVFFSVSGIGHTPVIDDSNSSRVVNVEVSPRYLKGELIDLDIVPLEVSSGTAPTLYADTISDLSLNLVLDSILGSVGGIGASASVSRDYGALEATGETKLAGLELSIAGKPFVYIDIPRTPNYIVGTPMSNLPGFSLIPNKQIRTRNDIIPHNQEKIEEESDQAATPVARDDTDYFDEALNEAEPDQTDPLAARDYSDYFDEVLSEAEPNRTPAPATATIPEPGTLALLGAGFAILSWKSRRKTAAFLA